MDRLAQPRRPLVGWLALVATAATALWITQPPAPRPVSAPEAEFSAHRALPHVEKIAARAHAWGTAANREVRDYLVAELEALGLEVRTQKVMGGWPVPLENLIGIRRGTRSTGLVALVAHYDSTAFGPGAGDDAAGVAAILEAVRALGTGDPLANDLLVLITDGEEAGLLGANLFCERDPMAKDIDVLINLEARGNAGRSLMFETSRGNADLVALYGEAAEDPAACSLMTAFYRLMPNSTDFAVFQRYGLRGLNFAFIGGAVHYHAPTDTPANLSLASMQHHGDVTLALTRRLGSMDLATIDHAHDAVYFDVLGRVFIRYPGWLEWVTIALLWIGLILVLRRGWTAGELSAFGIGYGLFAGLRTVLACAVLGGGVGVALVELLPDHVSRAARATTSDGWFFAALLFAWIAATTALHIWSVRRGREGPVLAGWFVLTAVLMTAGTAVAPGTSFLFLWPLILLLPALDRRLRGGGGYGLALTGLVASVLFAAPLVLLLFQGMGLVLALITGPLTALFLGLAAALLDPNGTTRARWIAGAPAVIAMLLVGIGVLAL